ncbi:MAG TPA: flagellin [Candidatus Thermoplasmatota archaeon]|nr:flagellin [Candidatus Thermoplasmatota archaeon]
MGKITKKLKADDIGDMGIGAMIVFIAMVLVAGIAASVLIQTANRLEIQAMQTGQETIGEVSTGLAVTSINGYRTALQENLSLMGITVQPRQGSFSIDLGQTYIELSDSGKKVILMYGAEFQDTTDINGDFFTPGFYDGLSSTTFGIIVLEDADGSISAATPVINKGDQVMLTVNLDLVFSGAPLGLPTRTDVWGLIQPEEGAPGVFAFTSPASYASDLVFNLY